MLDLAYTDNHPFAFPCADTGDEITAMLILSALCGGTPLSAYQIWKALRPAFETIRLYHLHPVLRWLEREGHIRAGERSICANGRHDFSKKPRMARQFSISPDGRDFLKTLSRHYRRMSAALETHAHV